MLPVAVSSVPPVSRRVVPVAANTFVTSVSPVSPRVCHAVALAGVMVNTHVVVQLAYEAKTSVAVGGVAVAWSDVNPSSVPILVIVITD